MRHPAWPSEAAVRQTLLLLLAFAANHPAGTSAQQPAEPIDRSIRLIDLDYFRFFGDFRFGMAWSAGELVEGLTLSDRADAIAGGFGFDLGRHTVLEARMNLYEFDLMHPERGRVGEFSTNAFVPRMRFKYPIGTGRWVPHVAVGVGVGMSQFNDPAPAAGKPEFIEARTTTSLAWNVGAGLDYFQAQNLALGVALSYQTTVRSATIDDEPADLSSKAILLTAGLTYYVPEQPFEAVFGGVDWGEPKRGGFRPYVTIRAGTKQRFDGSFGENADWRHGEALNAGSIGVDLDRRWGVELALENHDGVIEAGGRRLAEYATWMFLPRARFKLSDWSATFVPYLVAGAGLGTSEVNDASVRNDAPGRDPIHGSSSSVAGSAGVGVDIHTFGNMSFMLETTYLAYSSTIMEGDAPLELADSSLHISGGFRFYFR